MRGSLALRAVVTSALTALVVVGAAACGAPAFPRELFSVEAGDADYPVMLSRTRGERGGDARPISADSGTRATHTQNTYFVGNSSVTVSRTTSAQSELSASVKLAAQVKRSDRWVQIERAVFSAVNLSSYGSSSQERMLIIDASAYK